MDTGKARYAIGREGMIQGNGLEISVIVRDVRLRPFVVDYLVEPTAGTGQVWVESNAVRILETGND